MSRFAACLLVLTLAAGCSPFPQEPTVISATSYTPASYTATGGTVFATGWKFFASSDLTVTVDGTTKTEGPDYTVSGAGDDAGGNVTFTVAPTSGAAVVISRSTPKTQPTAFRTQGNYSPKVHENALDRATLIGQEVDARETTLNSAMDTRVSSLETSRTTDEANITGLTTRTTALETHDTTQDGAVSAIDARVHALEVGGSVPAPSTASYTGTPSAISARTALTVAELQSGSSLTADTITAPSKALVDKVSSLLAHGALLDVPNTFSAAQTMAGGYLDDQSHSASADFSPANGSVNGSAQRRDGLVTLQFFFSATGSISSPTTLFTLPGGMWPPVGFYAPVVLHSGGTFTIIPATFGSSGGLVALADHSLVSGDAVYFYLSFRV